MKRTLYFKLLGGYLLFALLCSLRRACGCSYQNAAKQSRHARRKKQLGGKDRRTLVRSASSQRLGLR